MMTDTIADMLTRIRNASRVQKKEVLIPFSKLKLGVANILLRTGYVGSVDVKQEARPYIVVTLKYDGRDSVIHELKRVSTPGHRRYVKKDEIRKVLNGYGVAILSTSHGLLTGEEAYRAKLGGELLCEVF